MWRHARHTLSVTSLAALITVSVMWLAAAYQTFQTEREGVRVDTFADGLVRPWGLAFLPDGRMLVTERPGRLRIVAEDGSLSRPLAGVPQVDARGQGGLLDVALHPRFADSRLVYLSYAEAGEGGNGTAVARGRLEEGDSPRLADVEVIFRQRPKVPSTGHFGTRLVFDTDGYLWITLGDRQAQQFRGQAQRLDNHIGKIVRLHDDGSVPDDNPFVGRDDALPEIWSYGHRNPQGAALHPETGVVWTHEHGPRGGDEINIPRRGANHGWPVATYGTEYSGETIFRAERFPEGMVEPLHYWVPTSIAPSGMAFYTGALFPAWQGNLFVGALAERMLVRLEVEGEEIVGEEHLLQALGKRIRDVRDGPDGALYLLTDEAAGEILRLTPAQGGGN